MAGDAMKPQVAAEVEAASQEQSSQEQALQDFAGKWRARWPEWSVAEVFVPRAQRGVAVAWAALQQELTDAAWGGSDALPGEAKLGWWMEELQGWRMNRRRHPLGLALQRQAAPWGDLALALPALRDSRERPGDRNEAFDGLIPVATAIGAIDMALFEPVPGQLAEAAVPAIQSSLLESRLVLQGDACVPLSVVARAMARPGEGAAVEWSRELLAQWPARFGATVPRRLWTALAHTRLQRGDAARPLSPWTALLAAWRGARN
ncbi:phytoene/squalene synthase family protein [Lysobacter gummosus]|uniref:phytoene/squalene synthase family protein n=2 Tax=Lysobacter gummosus TaxID=262324 RepID=UPI00363AF30C